MNKSVIFSLFLMALLLMGTSLNMNMFSTAMASEKDRDDKRSHYDDDNNRDDKRSHYDDDNRYEQSTYGQDRDDKRSHYDDDNRYEQSTYGQDPYVSSYDQSYGYDSQPVYGPQQPSYDKPQYDYSSQTTY